jgi:hypothetical protein
MPDTIETTTPAAAPTGGAPSPSPSAESHLDTLVSDAPRSEPTPDQPVDPPAAAPAPTPVPVEPVASAAVPSAPVQKYKYRGREYTAEELVKQGLLEDVLTSAEQLPHLQKKHLETLEKLTQQQQPPAQPQAEQPSITQAQIRAHYQSHIAEAVKQGYIEPDFADLYPDAVSQMLWHRDQLYQVKGQLAELAQGFSGTTRKSEAQTSMTGVQTNLDALAGQDAIYAPLKDSTEREGFLTWLTKEIDPPVKLMTPEWLGRQWMAYKSEAFLGVTRQANDAQKRADEDARRRAAGDGRGSRPAAPATTTPTHLDSLVAGALPTR